MSAPVERRGERRQFLREDPDHPERRQGLPCWLIERGQRLRHDPPIWFVSRSLGNDTWTHEAHKAQRFHRRDVAEAEADRLFGRLPGDWKERVDVTEHIFLNAPDRRQPPAEGMTIDDNARWLEIQAMSDAIANRDEPPNELESALCGAVWRCRQALRSLEGPSDAVAALKELVACKDLKEHGEKMMVELDYGAELVLAEYRRRQPLAWAAARAAILRLSAQWAR